jgi:hypothetical protein
MATYASALRSTKNAVKAFLGGTNPVQFVKSGSVAVAADALVIPLTHACVTKTTGADAEALTIANGVPGQIVHIVKVAGAGVGTLTVDTNSKGTGWTTIAFDTVLDTATLLYVDDTYGWIILGTFGATAQPTVSNS